MRPEKNMNETELLKAIKPLLVHNSWDYLSEYLLRQRARKLELLVRERDEVSIHRLQGQIEMLNTLIALEDTVMVM